MSNKDGVNTVPTPSGMKNVSFAEALNSYQDVLKQVSEAKNKRAGLLSEMRTFMRKIGHSFDTDEVPEVFESISQSDLQVYKVLAVTDAQKKDHQSKREIGSAFRNYMGDDAKRYLASKISPTSLKFIEGCGAYHNSGVSLQTKELNEKETTERLMKFETISNGFAVVEEEITLLTESLINWREYISFCKDIASIARMSKDETLI